MTNDDSAVSRRASEAAAAFGARIRQRRKELKMRQDQLALATGVRWLTPAFTAYPDAARAMMDGLRGSYIACCQAANRAPDDGLLAPIVTLLQRLEQSTGSGHGT